MSNIIQNKLQRLYDGLCEREMSAVAAVARVRAELDSEESTLKGIRQDRDDVELECERYGISLNTNRDRQFKVV